MARIAHAVNYAAGWALGASVTIMALGLSIIAPALPLFGLTLRRRRSGAGRVRGRPQPAVFQAPPIFARDPQRVPADAADE